MNGFTQENFYIGIFSHAEEATAKLECSRETKTCKKGFVQVKLSEAKGFRGLLTSHY